jgi:hypothetical protein
VQSYFLLVKVIFSTKKNPEIRQNILMKCTTHFLKWFLSHSVMTLCFTNVPHSGKFWNTSASTVQQKFGSWTFGCAHMTLQTQSCNCPLFELLFKSHHLTHLWIWSSSWGGLRMRLPCTHFQQFLSQKRMKFSVVILATPGWQIYVAIQHS